MRKLNRTIKVTSFIALLLLSFINLAKAEVVDIDNKALQKLIADGVTLVDVRRPDEWKNTGVVKGSQLMTFFDAKGEYDAQAWLSQLGGIVKQDTPVILICHSGNRSNVVSQWLSNEVGFERVYNVTDGIIAWQADGGLTVQP